jgi:two-component system alkaline phosphatase synthesis response regulator PhoP
MIQSVLVVDDERDIRELIEYNLTKAGYEVTTAASGEECLELVAKAPPDLLLLDLMLPGINGLDVCRALKRDASLSRVPIIMISARGEESDVVVGLELGADDYVPKPFSPRVLLARVKSVLRRLQSPPTRLDAILEVDGLRVDPPRREVLLDGAPTELTNTEFKLLHFLMRQPGLVFTRDKIVEGVHGDDYPVTDRSVDVQVVGLRKKLGRFGEQIETVRGVGYRFRSSE